MNRIIFIKLPKIGKYFEELREMLILASQERESGDLFRIEEARPFSVSGNYFRRRITTYSNLSENGGLREEEREVVDVFSFRIDARQNWIELYNPPRSIRHLMNRLSILSSGRLSYGIVNLNVVSAVGIFREAGEYKVTGLKFKDLIFKDAPLAFTGRAVGANLPSSFLEVSGQKADEIESITGVFVESGSEAQEKVELRKNSGICTSAALTDSRKSFYRKLVKSCEIE